MKTLLATILMTAALGAAAQTMYRWTDKDGKVHYSDRPPAAGEAAQVEQKRSITLGVAGAEPSAMMRQAMADYPVTLYTQTNCGEPCNSGRDHLKQRGIPYTEKSLSTQQDADALRAVVGGGDQLTVPVVQVGPRSAKGYLRSEWDSLLDAAGYPKAAAKSGR